MKRKYILIVSIFLSFINGENNECRTPSNDEYYLAKGIFSLSDLPIVNSDEELTIWIRAHIVRQNNGSGGISLSDIETSIFNAQSIFNLNNSNIFFQLDPSIDYIDDSNFYESMTENEEETLLDINDNPTLLDVYYIGSGVSRSESIGCTDLIIVNNTAINYSTFAHEIGHCLGLYHTHELQFGNEFVTRDSTDECFNCEYVGDQLCTTAADPGIVDKVDENCQINLQTIGYDICNNTQQYQPSTSNTMSYSHKDCRDEFTSEQVNVMRTVVYNLFPQDLYRVLAENRNEVTFENLGGQLTIINILTNEHVTVNSGLSFWAELNSSNTVYPHDFQNEMYHHRWWNSLLYNLQITDFEMDQIRISEGLIANFKSKSQITFLSPVQINLYDPWYLENPDADPEEWIQPDEFRPLSEQTDENGNIQVFLNQNSTFHPDNPIYRLKSPNVHLLSAYDYEKQYSLFSEWDYDNCTIENNDPTQHEIKVVFHEGADINAVHHSLSLINETITYNDSAPNGEIRGTINLIDNSVIVSSSSNEKIAKTPQYYFGSNSIFIFAYWETNTQDIQIDSPNSRETSISVLNSGGTLSAVYVDMLEGTGDAIVISDPIIITQDYSIPPGAHYTLNPGRKFIIENGAHFQINGTPADPILLLGSATQFWAGIHVDDGTLTVNNTVITHADTAIAINGYMDFNEDVLINNCTFYGNGIGVYRSNDNAAVDAVISIKNSIFKQNQVGAVLNLSYTFGGHHLDYNVFDENEDLNIIDDPSKCTSVGNQYGDSNMSLTSFQLSPGSIAIDNGDPDNNDNGITWQTDMDDQDPDGTRMDIGAFYYQLPSVIISFSETIEIGDHPLIEWEAPDVDDAVLSYEIYTYNELDMTPILWGATLTTNVLDHHYVITHFEDPDNIRLWKQGSPKEESQDFQKFYEVKVVDTEGHHSLTSNVIYAWVQQQRPSWKLVSELIPKDYQLNAAFPNPFNPTVTIPFALPLNSDVIFDIYNVMGQLVKSLQFDNFQAGFHQVQWNSLTDNGQKVPSGMYIVRMKAISTEGKKMFQKSQKIVYLK
ncbi:MAG: T9SS type A sorting domain-containing protein [Candidatus Marinimicrobia bacterium]|jgi:hypothetical protein|nr:T9SS type A sorting domain-containing protein [Candidatus Neomarinimicrobiota bacterium]MBT3502249.1 T9SS type A sorting domain-containing protein [Candidatus Neomarinimicrobiota bacterium]MBT3840551.1 T9SS type A sorting domain-containing protein [Candidatus Neomarinimicrobiota bacterium]MBT3999591.1 T9SS type A sorting domain-containing protein [Candidatus Neomarinimicrobiota bacterium]MBT4282902.1 T9SS type A sorting domain-containing protein [Candidatus Neomarinimicrobiota bacterium]